MILLLPDKIKYILDSNGLVVVLTKHQDTVFYLINQLLSYPTDSLFISSSTLSLAKDQAGNVMLAHQSYQKVWFNAAVPVIDFTDPFIEAQPPSIFSLNVILFGLNASTSLDRFPIDQPRQLMNVHDETMIVKRLENNIFVFMKTLYKMDGDKVPILYSPVLFRNHFLFPWSK